MVVQVAPELMDGSIKPLVHYRGEVHFSVCGAALVLPVDHPHRSNLNVIRTSRVIRREDCGEFETLNTVYRRFNPLA